MHFKINQLAIEIGFGIGILLMTSAALMFAMQQHPETSQHSCATKLLIEHCPFFTAAS